MALETPFLKKKIKSKGAWARAPQHFGSSRSPALHRLLAARLPVPFPQSRCSCKAMGGGISQGPCDSSGRWQAVELPEVFVLPVLPCHELQGFSAVASRASSQQLQGGLCNGWLLKIERPRFASILTKSKQPREGREVGESKDHVTGGRGLCHMTD